MNPQLGSGLMQAATLSVTFFLFIFYPFSIRRVNHGLNLRFCPFTDSTEGFFDGCYVSINASRLGPSLKLRRCPPPPKTHPVHSFCVSEFASQPFCFCSAGCEGRGCSHPASTGVEPRANGSVWCAVTSSLSQSSADLHFFFPPPRRPSREVVLVTSLVVNNSFQWDKLAFHSGLLHPSGTSTVQREVPACVCIIFLSFIFKKPPDRLFGIRPP